MGKYNLGKSKIIQNYITSLLDKELLASQKLIVENITKNQPGLGKVHSQDVSNAITKLVDMGGAVIYTVFKHSGVSYIRPRRGGERGGLKYVSAQEIMFPRPLAPPLSFKIKKNVIVTESEFAGDIIVKNLLETPIYRLELKLSIQTRVDEGREAFSVPVIRPFTKESFFFLQRAKIKKIGIEAKFTNGYENLMVKGELTESDIELGTEVYFDLAQELSSVDQPSGH